MFRFFENLYDFSITNDTTAIHTAIRTVTYKVEPIIYTADNKILSPSLYETAIDSDGYIVIKNLDIPVGSYTVFRNTLLDIKYGANRLNLKQNLVSVLQYLTDLAHTSSGLVFGKSIKLIDKFRFLLEDHLLSFHRYSKLKPVKNPPWDILTDNSDLNKRKLFVTQNPPVLFFEYLSRYPLPALKALPESGCSEFINDNSITPIKSITLDGSILTVTMYKYLFNTMTEDPTSAIYRFTFYPSSAKIYIHHLMFETKNIKQGVGELTMTFENVLDLPQNQISNLAISLDDDFIPLKVFYSSRRDYPD